MLPFHLVILGPQGSGKGTQARLLSEKFKMPYFSAGELIRKKSRSNTEEGRKVKALHDAGMLIPNEITKKLIENELKKIPQSQTVIFEGYPRTMDQVKDFEDILRQRDKKDKKIIVLDVKESTVYQRISGRRVCVICEKNYYPPDSLTLKNCIECGGELIKRSDDTKEAIEKRLHIFKNETKPVIDYYKKRGELLEINGEPKINEVTKEIIQKLGRSN
jgi:adenylate kinase